MSCRIWKCAPEAISGFVDIPKGPGCHLTDKVSVKAADINSIIKCFIHSQLVFVIFSSFLKLNETVMLPNYVNNPPRVFEVTPIFQVFVLISLAVNLFFNETLLMIIMNCFCGMVYR